MKTGTTLRGAALLLAWAAVSAIASAQAQGSTASEAETMVAMGRTEGAETVEGRAGSAAFGRMNEWLGTFDEIRGGLERNDGFIRSDDGLVLAFLFEPMQGESQLLRQYLKNVADAVHEVPETFYAQLDAKVDGLWQEINRLAPTLEPIGGAETGSEIRAAIEDRVLLGAPDATILRTVLAGDRWNAKLTDAGVPRSEYRRGYVTYRLPDQELVVCQQIVVERPFFGTPALDDYGVRLGYLRLQTTP